MENKAQLLPCRFCQSANVKLFRTFANENAVCCKDCSATGPSFKIPQTAQVGLGDKTAQDQAIAAWNTRALTARQVDVEDLIALSPEHHPSTREELPDSHYATPEAAHDRREHNRGFNLASALYRKRIRDFFSKQGYLSQPLKSTEEFTKELEAEGFGPLLEKGRQYIKDHPPVIQPNTDQVRVCKAKILTYISFLNHVFEHKYQPTDVERTALEYICGVALAPQPALHIEGLAESIKYFEGNNGFGYSTYKNSHVLKVTEAAKRYGHEKKEVKESAFDPDWQTVKGQL